MKLSKTIDQTRICKKSYDDPLGYFCMGVFFDLSRRTSDQQISLVQRTFPLVSDNRTNVIIEAWIYGSLYPHSQSGGYTGIPFSVRPSLNLVYVTSHLSFVGFYSYLVSLLAMI
jgi:hypothetical protein